MIASRYRRVAWANWFARAQRTASDASRGLRQPAAFAALWLVVVLASNARAADDHGDLARPGAIIAGRYVAPDGSLKTDVTIVIQDGRILRVAPSDPLSTNQDVVRYPNAVVCPGLIDVRSSVGAVGRNVETAHAIDPGASAIVAIDWRHRDFRSVLESGVTTVVVAPASNNLISGAVAVVKTAGSKETAVLRSDGPLMFALGPSVWLPNRAPTSRSGSLAMIRKALGRAREGSGHDRLTAFVNGRLDAMIVCADAMDVSAAIRTFGEYEGVRAVIHTGDTHQIAEELSAAGMAIVTGPYTFDMTPRTLSGAAAYASAGVPIVFAGQMPRYGTDALRITASLAVRHGLDPAKARLAITAGAAALVGVGDRVGAIEPGLDADLVVFSDDPLRLDARVLEVYVGGERVYHNKHVTNSNRRSNHDR